MDSYIENENIESPNLNNSNETACIYNDMIVDSSTDIDYNLIDMENNTPNSNSINKNKSVLIVNSNHGAQGDGGKGRRVRNPYGDPYLTAYGDCRAEIPKFAVRVFEAV